LGIAIVIGASTGIGRQTAINLADYYKSIAVTSFKHQEELFSLKNELESKGCRCFCQCGDAGSYEFVHEFINHATNELGDDIELLINNAGISHVGLLQDMSSEEFENVMHTNVHSVFNSCKLVIPHMLTNHYGKIINISSVWGNVGASCEVAYSASKGAINSFSKALAKELAPSGIAVNAIAFGAVDTSMNNHLSCEEKIQLCEEIPAGRMATPREAAEFIANICCANNYLTGQVLTFDGAWT
jgi:3-oxoacyl-[acyl-carrier protein] reductase